MEDFVYYNNLYDIYHSLLTEKECLTFKDYYQEDLSLSEIAENNNISRTAVQKTIKNVLEKLNNYEDKLHLYTKEQKLKQIDNINSIEEIKNIIKDILS